MPPPGGGKRKRGDRSYSGDNYARPSPHRPENLNLAQGPTQSPRNGRQYTDSRGRGGRRPSRGGKDSVMSSSPRNTPDMTIQALDLPAPDFTRQPSTNGRMAVPSESAATTSTTESSPPPPYAYILITDETCQHWKDWGRQAVVQKASDSLNDSDDITFGVFLEELVQSVLVGRVDPSTSGTIVKQLVNTITPEADTLSQALETSNIRTAVLSSISIACERSSDLRLDRLAAFLLAAEIPPEHLRHELDANLLEKLDLIRNTFNRMGIRKQTNVLYRQANFNLLREESEGFAKLMTELFMTSGNEPPSGDVVEEAVEKVKATIGAFDLDVGRTLDVVLDVFGAVLVKQFRFFVKFLRASPWWPRQATEKTSGLPLWALPGVAGWHLTEEQQGFIAAEAQTRDKRFWAQAQDRGLQAFYGPGLEDVDQTAPTSSGDGMTNEWLDATGTVPPSGNRDAAQLLGFKLRFYSSSLAREDTDVLPDNLIYLSALLIKIGFISLKDLYPHIWRLDDAMEELKQQKLKEKADRERSARPGAGARNALLTAGALADDTLPIPPRLRETSTRAGTPSKEPEAEKLSVKESPSEPPDQKVLLLKSLLAIGALPEALFILGRFPWLLDLYPDLPEYIHRILHYSLSKMYEPLRPLHDRLSFTAQKPSYETDTPGLPKGQVKIATIPERKVLRWALLDRNDSLDGTDYRFYWDEWSDNIPVCRTVDDVFTLCNTLLPLVGVKIGQDPGLVLTFARIGKQSLHQDMSEMNRARWLDLSKRTLLPALSMTKSNAGVVNEVFELISHFPINTRYLMYLEWSTGKTSRNPDIKTAFDQAKAETKDILKRISKTNVRPMARALAKVAYANPHIVITTALAQIEVYDSIAEVFVEGARYFTDLGYDVLTWAMISSMARAGRSRTQDGGIFTSRWLSALAQFAGKIYRRYSMMRPAPVLQYVVEQLDHGNSTDLKMLEQIVVSMAGIATDTSYNDTQLQAMGGGPLLQSQTILQLLDRRNDANTKVTSRRLTKALQDSGLTGKILISMAQQRQSCVFEEGDVPLKAVGNTFDEIHRIMVQYLDLLRSNLSVEDFTNTIPDVLQLLIDYEIRPEIAFAISRPLIAKQIVDFDHENVANRKTEDLNDGKELNGDVEMSDQINPSSDEDGEALETDDNAPDVATPTDAEISGVNLDLETNDKTSPLPEAEAAGQWHPVLKSIMEEVEPTLPAEIVDVIGTGFYITFWQLSLYDITIPGKSYEDELSRQHKKIAAISADRSDVSLSGTRRKEAEKKVIGELIDNLLAENKQHLKAFAESKARLQREKELWFLGKARIITQLNTAMMEHCFLPRILASPLDAYFCFKFIKFLHSTGTSNFRTLGFYDLLFRSSRITSLIFTCTSKEADNLGRFLNDVLRDLTRWHTTKATYEREAWGMKKSLPGFAMRVEAGKVVSLLDFESFRRVLYKWHGQVYIALQKCLTSPEYMHVRNAISVLRAVAGVYPSVNWHGTGLQKSVDKLRESDKEDLKVASQALLGALYRREKSWIIPQAFRQGQDKSVEEVASTAKQQTEEKVVEAKPSNTSAAKAEDEGEVKDVTMKDTSIKHPIRSIEPKKEQSSVIIEGEKKGEPEGTPRAPRPHVTNGPATPRSVNETPISDKRENRPTRPESAKAAGLPRRLSPGPRHPHPATLPSRPDSIEFRNGHRESPRTSSRLPLDSGRPSSEGRPPHPRDTRPGYRGVEPPYEEYDRHGRRPDRPEGLLHGPRDDRGYGREREIERSHGPPERTRPSDRDRLPDRERAPPRSAPRDRDTRERPTRSAASAQLPSEDPQVRPSVTSARPPSSQSESVSINPDRAALIDNGPDVRSGPTTRGPGPERPARSSRPSSPRRDEDRRPPHRQDREDRHGPERRSEIGSNLPPSSLSSSAAPGHRPGPPSQYSRDGRAPYSHGQIDMQQGRLEQDPSHRPPPRNERATDSDVPSGPRARPGMQAPKGRGAPPINTQVSQTPSTDRPTPTGPSARHSRNNTQHDVPVAAPPMGDGGGVHPSRLNQIEPPSTESSRPLPPPPAASTSVVQTGPPAGPRGNAPVNAPSGPSPTSRGPPAGPHMGDGSHRGGRSSRHPLTAVNSTLSQAGQGTSIRGRGGMRQNSGTFSSHMAQAGSHGSRSEGFPPQQDLFGAPNPNGVPVAARPGAPRQDGMREKRQDGEDRDGERRSSRRHEDGRERDGHRNSAREGRDGKDEREPPRREERPVRREDGQQGDDRRNYKMGPRDEGQPRKHGREDGAPYGGGSGGRGGSSRAASETKRPRRGP